MTDPDKLEWEADYERAIDALDANPECCRVDGCESAVHARTLCSKHYQRWRAHGDPERVRPSLWERFWSRVDKSAGPDACWEWTGVRNSAGYGQIALPNQGGMAYAHRLTALLYFGPYDRRLFVCHHCDNPCCVNPAHLYVGTPKDNVRDMHERGRWTTSQATKTHCKNGHEFTPENTYISVTNGQRTCRACKRDWWRRNRDRN